MRFPHKPVILASLLGVFAMVCVGTATADGSDKFIGYVSEIGPTKKAVWNEVRDRVSHRLKPYSPVHEGFRLRTDGPTNWIEVRLIDRSTVTHRGMADNNLEMKLASQPSVFDISLWQSALEQLTAKPEIYVSTISRAVDLPNFAVVSLDKNTDFSEVFANHRPTNYEFNLQMIDEESERPRGKTFGPFSVKHSTKVKDVVSLPDMKPGVYRLTIAGSTPADEASSWILLSSPETYFNDHKRWNEAQLCLDAWTKDKPKTIETMEPYLKSVLFTLTKSRSNQN